MQRNYHLFYMFVSSTTLLCLYVFAFSWVNLVKIMGAHHCNLWRAIVKSPVSAILIVYTFIAAWFVGGLTAFHTYLVCTNQVSLSLSLSHTHTHTHTHPPFVPVDNYVTSDVVSHFIFCL